MLLGSRACFLQRTTNVQQLTWKMVWSSSFYSQKSLNFKKSPGGKILQKCEKVWKRVKKVPKQFCPLVVALLFFYDSLPSKPLWRRNKEKSHKGIWWSQCHRSVPRINSGRLRDTRDVWADLCGNSNSRGAECPRDRRDIWWDRWDMSMGQSGDTHTHTPGGVPPKFFIFIGFFFPHHTLTYYRFPFRDRGVIVPISVTAKLQPEERGRRRSRVMLGQDCLMVLFSEQFPPPLKWMKWAFVNVPN